MNNNVIATRTDEHFIAGEVYECGSVFVQGSDAFVEVTDKNGEVVIVNINDPDYRFIIFNGGRRD